MTRSNRLAKKLHKIHLVDVASDVVQESEWIRKLMEASEGEPFKITPDSLPNGEYGKSVLQRYNLDYEVLRQPLDEDWIGPTVEADELLLRFRATSFPSYQHGWLLFAQDLVSI